MYVYCITAAATSKLAVCVSLHVIVCTCIYVRIHVLCVHDINVSAILVFLNVCDVESLKFQCFNQVIVGSKRVVGLFCEK